jgi:hypothetical protein
MIAFVFESGVFPHTDEGIGGGMHTMMGGSLVLLVRLSE